MKKFIKDEHKKGGCKFQDPSEKDKEDTEEEEKEEEEVVETDIKKLEMPHRKNKKE